MRINRFFTISDNNPYANIRVKSFMDENTGHEVLMPVSWTAAMREIWLEEIFFKYGISNNLQSFEEPYLPEWMHRKIVIKQGTESENDFRQVFDRIAGEWVYSAWKKSFFDSEEDAVIFYDEARFIMANGYGLPEFSQLKYTGLNWAYGVEVNSATPKHKIADSTKAIFDIGFSNAGINFDKISKGQNIDHLLKLINNISLLNSKSNYLLNSKSNLSMDIKSAHVADFINWKRKSEQDELSKRLGAKLLKSHMNNIIDKYDRDSLRGFDPSYNLELRRAIFAARDFKVPDSAIREALLFARQGFESVPILSLDNNDLDDEDIISDNLSLSLLVDDEFIEASMTGHSLKNLDGNNIDCQIIFDNLVETNWTVGEPDILFSNTINEWSGVSGSEDIKSTGSNAGFLFLEDTSCPTATINLLNFADDGVMLNYKALEYTAKILSIALNSSLSFMNVSDKTKEYNPIGVGYTNLGSILMDNGIPYDSDEAREFTSLITAYINLSLQEMSVEIANNNEVFYKYSDNMKQFINVLENQLDVISGKSSGFNNNISKKPLTLALGQELAARWKELLKFTKQYGSYNSHVSFLCEDYQMDILLNSFSSCISPLKTITDFVESENGTMMKTISQVAVNGLRKLELSASQIDDVILYIIGNYSLLDAPYINHESLKKKGFTAIELQKIEQGLKSVSDINHVFNRWVLGDEFIMSVLGLDKNELASGSIDVLQMLGFNKSEIEAANLFCCGANRINGAPHLNPEAYKIFDCINNSEKDKERSSVSIDARLKMSGHVQPLLSGGIGQVISLPEYTTTDRIQEIYLKSWEYGLKSISIYRENCSILSEYQMELPNNGAISIKTKMDKAI